MDPPPDSIVGAEVVGLCVSSDGTKGLSLLRLQPGDQTGLQYVAVQHFMRRPDRSAVIGLKRGRPLQVAHCPNKDLALIGCDDGSIYLLTSNDQQLEPRLLGRNPRGCIHQLAFSPDNRSLVILDAETGEIRGRLTGHTQQVKTLVTSGDHLLHSGDRDGTIRTWDLHSAQQIQQFSLAPFSAR